MCQLSVSQVSVSQYRASYVRCLCQVYFVRCLCQVSLSGVSVRCLCQVSPFLTDKIRGRLQLHGREREALHRSLGEAILPREYGGGQVRRL